MPQLPENIRPAVALLKKHHFWLLAALVPLVVVPLLFSARAGLQAKIKSARAKIKGDIDAIAGIRAKDPHPNREWSSEIDADTIRIRRETLEEWQKFWNSQQFLRKWPEALGPDFLQAVTELKPDGKLDRDMLQRYQNEIVDKVVRKLPGLMGAVEAMGDERDAQTAAGVPAAGAGGAGQPERDRRPPPILVWDPSDQRKLAGSFAWKELPRDPLAATTQVLLAQEELWVYGLFCDAIKQANRDAAGRYNAAIVGVEQLAVGYPAAEEKPGGVGGTRIVMPKQAAGAALPEPPPAGPAGGPLGKPQHPRWGGPMAGPLQGAEAIPGADRTPAGAPDASLREWIYVDFDRRPLSAADVAISPAARMVHLMPFTLRMTIDERRIDAFLVALATAPVPIDVREVRINPGADSKMAAAGQQPAAGQDKRPHDVSVELRGTVGLATPPSAAAVGLEPPAPAPTDAAAAAAMVVGRKERA